MRNVECCQTSGYLLCCESAWWTSIFLLLCNPEKQMGRPGLTAADQLCVSVMNLAHCSSLTIALKKTEHCLLCVNTS